MRGPDRAVHAPLATDQLITNEPTDPALLRGARGPATVGPRLHRPRASRPHAQQWEQERWFSRRGLSEARRAGPARASSTPEEYGGQGGDYLHEAVLCEEMARTGFGAARPAGIGAPHQHCDAAAESGSSAPRSRNGATLVPAIRGRADRRAGHNRARGRGPDDRGARHARRGALMAAGWSTARRPYITNGVRAAGQFIVTRGEDQ